MVQLTKYINGEIINFLYNALVVRCLVFGECFLKLVIGQPLSWCSLLIGRSYGKRKAQLQLRRNASMYKSFDI